MVGCWLIFWRKRSVVEQSAGAWGLARSLGIFEHAHDAFEEAIDLADDHIVLLLFFKLRDFKSPLEWRFLDAEGD